MSHPLPWSSRYLDMLKVSVTVEDKDLGMKALMRRLVEDEDGAVDIGVHSDEDQKLVVIAAANEFGTANIPARPYIRSTVDENEEKYFKASTSLMGKMIDEDMTKTQGLTLMGQLIEGDIKKKIRILKDPPNAPATIRLKGSDNPLIDKGFLLNSIRYVVKKEQEIDGSS